MLNTDNHARKRLNSAGVIWSKVELSGYMGTDCFGLFDYLAVTPTGIVGIQVTTRDHAAEHRDTFSSDATASGKKAYTYREATEAWLGAGGLIELWLFDKPDHGVRCRVEQVQLNGTGEVAFTVTEDRKPKRS